MTTAGKTRRGGVGRIVAGLLVLTLTLGLLAGAALIGFFYWLMSAIGENLPEHRDLAWDRVNLPRAEARGPFTPYGEYPPHVRAAFAAATDPCLFEREVGPVRTPAAWIVEFVELLSALEDGRYAHEAECAAVSPMAQRIAQDVHPEWARPKDQSGSWMVLAYRIERDLPKRRIFELYLDSAFFGRGAFGAEAAANAYFGKPVAQTSVAEAAFLAGLPRDPEAFDPALKPENRERAVKRRDAIIQRMLAAGAISTEEAKSAQEETLPGALGGAP